LRLRLNRPPPCALLSPSAEPTQALTRWAPGEPNNGGKSGKGGSAEDCAYVHGQTYPSAANAPEGTIPTVRGRWGDHPCADKMAYVCELPDDLAALEQAPAGTRSPAIIHSYNLA
jgi:hypothetical protein